MCLICSFVASIKDAALFTHGLAACQALATALDLADGRARALARSLASSGAKLAAAFAATDSSDESGLWRTSKQRRGERGAVEARAAAAHAQAEAETLKAVYRTHTIEVIACTLRSSPSIPHRFFYFIFIFLDFHIYFQCLHEAILQHQQQAYIYSSISHSLMLEPDSFIFL